MAKKKTTKRKTTKKKTTDHFFWLRIGFGIFLAIWGYDRFMRADVWASESLMGQFYGDMGMMVGVIKGLAVAQLLIAAAFFTNNYVRVASLVLFAMLVVSTFVTIMPLWNYLSQGGAPIPAILFADHFPLLAGAWAIFEHSK